MEVAVIGGGIVGLFAARYLEEAGAEVRLYESGPPGAGSVHAAGIIEPSTAYTTNTWAFLRRVRRFARHGTCTFRSVDPRWLLASARGFERPPGPTATPEIRELSAVSVDAYRRLAEERNDFGYSPRGLLELFDDPLHFAEQRDAALADRAFAPVEVREGGGRPGLFFPEVAWVDTRRLVERVVREYRRTTVVRERVDALSSDGAATVGSERRRFDAVVACTGVSCRRLGVPLTAVRGYGWQARLRGEYPSSTIFVDRGIAVAPFEGSAKVTGGWDFDLGDDPARSAHVLSAIRRTVDVAEIGDFQQGARPCTPDGLPTVGRQERLVVATGGFRLGWSFGPGIARHAARLALGLEGNAPFLARFCGALRGGRLR
ncbi:MAG TPA: FAD-dependent oxidoreductase [Thermoplasmata archaeon]|nr:FAD-dependent oxidoreductase [Thermoplasmata archaeon]